MQELSILFGCAFLLLMLLNTPIAVALALATLLSLIATGSDASYVLASKFANGLDSFALLAIPFFILAGYLMGQGGMAHRLMDFAASLVGRFPGGLAYANALTCMMFGSVSGSATAAVSSVGSFMIPQMNQRGYPRDFNIALTATAATTGVIIPPSNVMIVFAVAAGGVSIADLFLAGIFPGILIGLSLCLVCFLASLKLKFPAEAPAPLQQVGLAFKRAFLSLLLVVIILGGILSGIYTATEAAAVAVLYALVVSVFIYKSVRLTQLPSIFLKTGATTAVVMLLIGASSGMAWMLSSANIPQQLSESILALSENKYLVLLAINLLLLLVGIFMDITPAILIFTPILLPVMRQFGISDIHFGIIMISNLCIGLCTPPVGTCLFVGCGVGKSRIAKVAPYMLPFFLSMIIAILVLTFVPAVSEWLPRAYNE
ncbi:TRAP transporter large permease [Agaribacterium sp. ZY112]|uniref:TRAP transporter large permease n=1 Tax=Agaribacterium sp. ZY112 TaxID=3233574 RepID=UPI0035238E71